MFFDRIDNLDNLDDVEWCFAHLPLRHTYGRDWILRVIDLAWARITPDCHEFMRRFLKASYERCPNDDQASMLQTTFNNTSFSPEKHAKTLAFVPTDVVSGICDNHIVNAVKKAVETHRPKKLLMSLSGGSDSMVAFHVLHGLREYYDFDLEVVMINYTNRQTAYDEESFVADWANSLGYPIHVRRIEEIHRKKCVDNGIRTLYESYTRNVRYSSYKTIGGMVVMGHNKDDCLENILQNIGAQHKYDNLCGMDVLTEQDGIDFFRPLLDISKDDIVEYAKEHNIPFLPNSTPAHFQRGKIRNSVAPCLNAWNDLFIPGMFQAKSVMAEMHKVVEMNARMLALKFENASTAIVDKAYMEMGEYFWSLVLKNAFPQEVFRNKMLKSLTEAFSRHDTNTNFILNKNVSVHVKTVGNDIWITFM
jgi:tRNA(Ile)-lysidine synthetase-like protein